MRKFAWTLIAVSALAFSGAALSQTNTTQTPGNAGMQAGKSDPIVENREERAQAKKAYRKDKSVTRQQYKQERAAAKRKLDEKMRKSGGGRDEDKTIRGGGQ